MNFSSLQFFLHFIGRNKVYIVLLRVCAHHLDTTTTNKLHTCNHSQLKYIYFYSLIEVMNEKICGNF